MIMAALSEQPPVCLSLFLQWQGICPGGGGHAPETEGAGRPVAAGHDGTRHDNLYAPADRRDRTTEGLGNDVAGLFAGGDEGAALRNPGQQGGDVRRPHNLQERI